MDRSMDRLMDRLMDRQRKRERPEESCDDVFLPLARVSSSIYPEPPSSGF